MVLFFDFLTNAITLAKNEENRNIQFIFIGFHLGF